MSSRRQAAISDMHKEGFKSDGTRAHPATGDRDLMPDEVEFAKAIYEYKRKTGRQFPSWAEVLDVLKSLGYVKVSPQCR